MQKIKISQIRQGQIRQRILPAGFIARVQLYKEILCEVEPCSLEETICNFMRDIHPERELEVWEFIARSYQEYINNHSDLSIGMKKEVFGGILESTFAM